MAAADTSNLIARAIEQLAGETGAQMTGDGLILPFADLHEIVIRPAREGARVVMESALLVVPKAGRGAMVRAALRCNASPSDVAGGALFLDGETSVLMLRAETPVGAEGSRDLARAVPAFVETCATLLEEMKAALSAPAEVPLDDKFALLRA